MYFIMYTCIPNKKRYSISKSNWYIAITVPIFTVIVQLYQCIAVRFMELVNLKVNWITVPFHQIGFPTTLIKSTRNGIRPYLPENKMGARSRYIKHSFWQIRIKLVSLRLVTLYASFSPKVTMGTKWMPCLRANFINSLRQVSVRSIVRGTASIDSRAPPGTSNMACSWTCIQYSALTRKWNPLKAWFPDVWRAQG